MIVLNDSFEIEEIIKYYNKDDLDNWKDIEWWDSGAWKEFIPPEEHCRKDKFYNQACKNPNNKYTTAHGNHFAEILEIIEFNKNGYECLYDNYKLFKDIGPNAQKFFEGTEKVKQIIGRSKIKFLYDIVLHRVLNPGEPDLFVFKENDLRFIEVKRDKDRLSPNQITGIKLIAECLKIKTQLVRYIGR